MRSAFKLLVYLKYILILKWKQGNTLLATASWLLPQLVRSISEMMLKRSRSGWLYKWIWLLKLSYFGYVGTNSAQIACDTDQMSCARVRPKLMQQEWKLAEKVERPDLGFLDINTVQKRERSFEFVWKRFCLFTATYSKIPEKTEITYLRNLPCPSTWNAGTREHTCSHLPTPAFQFIHKVILVSWFINMLVAKVKVWTSFVK